jgi:predicted anti-sigma-YlaC factor YlaD
VPSRERTAAIGKAFDSPGSGSQFAGVQRNWLSPLPPKTRPSVGRAAPFVLRPVSWLLLLALALATTTGCSVRRLAMNQVGNALAGTGTTFAADDDPDFVKQAVPFGLKTMEAVLAEVPDHQALRRAAASGFAQYSFAFIQMDADEAEAGDFAQAEALRARARRMYLRARNHGLAGLEATHRGFTNHLASAPREAVRVLKRTDVPLLYWTAVAWGGAISLSKDQPGTISEIPHMEALIDRALELDESYDQGAIHGFLISYELARSDQPADAQERARKHFVRAVELSQGRQVAPYVSFAEAVSVQTQNPAEFDELLAKALAINPDAFASSRLANLIYQRRARWLLGRRDELFLIPEIPAKP